MKVDRKINVLDDPGDAGMLVTSPHHTL